MKKFSYQFALAALVSGLFLTFNYNIKAQTDARALRGDEAVNQLKQTGSYDSLVSAVKAARQTDGRFANTPDAPDAVGQTAQLIAAPTGGNQDQFGASVAVSGDTAIVGAPYNDPNGVADQGAAYIFINSNGIWTEQTRLLGSNAGANDYFGNSVGISGDTVVIGARHNKVGQNAAQGAVYIFTRSNGVWTQQARIFAADGAGNDNFGSGVGIDGDTIVVGASNAAVGANGFQGAAYIYTRTSGVWMQQAKLASSDGAAFDAYGTSVAISGNNVIVGAYLATVNGRAYQGAAYIYARTGIGWNLQAKLVASDGAAGDRLGYSVGISGNTAIAGAFQSKVGANNYQGSAYIFVGTNGVWAQQAKLIASDGAAADAFGFSVAVEGNTAVVGSINDQVGTNFSQGSAYIFAYDNTLNIWKQQAKLTASDGAASDDFGSSVAINGGNIFVGAYQDTVGTTQRGSVYIFRTLSGNWTQNTKSLDPYSVANDNFGASVAVSGDTAVVSAPQTTIGSNAQGVAWIFVRNGASWTLLQALYDPNGAANDNFGASVAISGDTIIIGANLDDVGANADQGSAYVFARINGSWSQQAYLTATGGAANDRFGGSVAVSGNTVIVGATQNDVGANADQGSAYVFTRSGTNWTQQAQLNGTNGAANDRFGGSVGISGDTAVVGAFRSTVGANANQGSAYVFTRSGTNWTQQQQLTALDGAANDQFGYSVAVSGETIIVGASLDDVGANADQGSAYIFVRTGTNWTQQAQLNGAGGAAGDSFGYSVGIDGDTAIIGAAFDDFGVNADQGSAYIFERNGTTWTQKQQLIDSSGAAGDKFGGSVAVSGDKVIVGAPFSDTSASNPFSTTEKTSAPTAADTGAAIFFVNAPLAPTAAAVSVSGRVITPLDLGLTNALVTLTDSRGVSRTVITGKFGGFIFRNVAAGETYILRVSSKHYTYAPQIISPTEDLTGITFTPQ